MFDDRGNEYYQVIENGVLKTIDVNTGEVVQEEIINAGLGGDFDGFN